MSAASRATAVPATPIATPMSAWRSAGASLTPSPVMATTWRSCWSARTRRSLCSGATRAKTTASSAACRSDSSSRASRSRPVSTSPSGNPSSRAIAAAVAGWSPVIIFTATPAPRQAATASAASLRGGSLMAISPSNVSPPGASSSRRRRPVIPSAAPRRPARACHAKRAPSPHRAPPTGPDQRPRSAATTVDGAPLTKTTSRPSGAA